jgi:hypothetical protein
VREHATPTASGTTAARRVTAFAIRAREPRLSRTVALFAI